MRDDRAVGRARACVRDDRAVGRARVVRAVRAGLLGLVLCAPLVAGSCYTQLEDPDARKKARDEAAVREPGAGGVRGGADGGAAGDPGPGVDPGADSSAARGPRDPGPLVEPGGDPRLPPGPPQNPSPRSLVWYPPPQGIELQLWVTPRTLELGDALSLEIVVENTRPSRFEQHFPTGCTIGFEVVDDRGRQVAPSRVCTQAPVMLRLEAGERRAFRREWARGEPLFDAFEALVPGRYWITAGFIEGQRVRPMVEPVRVDVVARGR